MTTPTYHGSNLRRSPLRQNLRHFCVLLRLLRLSIIQNPFVTVLFRGNFSCWHIPDLFVFLLHLLLPCQLLIFLILLFLWRPVCFLDPLSFFLFAVPFIPFGSFGPNKIARLKKVLWNTLTYIHSDLTLFRTCLWKNCGKNRRESNSTNFFMPKKCYSNLSFRDLIKLQTEQVIRPLTTYQISLKILDPWKSEWNAFNKNYTQDFFEMIQIKITLLYHPSI